MSTALNPVPVLIKALAALEMVKELDPSQQLTGAQWLRVAHAYNELECHIDSLQLEVKAYTAIVRGPQIAKAMEACMPGVAA